MKTEIKWGLIFSIVSLLWLALEYLVGLHDKHIASHPKLTLLFFFPAVLMMYLAIREKKNVLGGRITFKQAFICGLIVSAIVALLAPLKQLVFHRLINPRFFDNMINQAVLSGSSTPERARSFFNLGAYILADAAGALIAGTVTTLVIAALIRSRNL